MKASTVVELASPLLPEVALLFAESDAHAQALYPPESNHLVDAATLAQPQVLFCVARRAGEVIGCGAAVVQPEGYAEIKRMFVRAPARGQGVGRQILAFLEEQLCLRQIGLARLETGIDSPEALGLYASMGYARTPPFAGYSEDPLSVFYAKELVSPAGPPQTHPQEE